jgi:hypothetical protein
MQNEIAMLQSKIKGLESKLSPYNSASANAIKHANEELPRQLIHPSFGSKQEDSTTVVFKSGGIMGTASGD